MAARRGRRLLDDFQHIDERLLVDHEDSRKGTDQVAMMSIADAMPRAPPDAASMNAGKDVRPCFRFADVV